MKNFYETMTDNTDWTVATIPMVQEIFDFKIIRLLTFRNHTYPDKMMNPDIKIICEYLALYQKFYDSQFICTDLHNFIIQKKEFHDYFSNNHDLWSKVFNFSVNYALCSNEFTTETDPIDKRFCTYQIKFPLFFIIYYRKSYTDFCHVLFNPFLIFLI
jgi:hypothetical protein